MFSKKFIFFFLCLLAYTPILLQATLSHKAREVPLKLKQASLLAQKLLNDIQISNGSLPVQLIKDFKNLTKQMPMLPIIRQIFMASIDNKLQNLHLKGNINPATLMHYLLFFFTLHCMQSLIINKNTAIRSIQEVPLTHAQYEAIRFWMVNFFKAKYGSNFFDSLAENESYKQLRNLYWQSNCAYKKIPEIPDEKGEEEDGEENAGEENCCALVCELLAQFLGLW